MPPSAPTQGLFPSPGDVSSKQTQWHLAAAGLKDLILGARILLADVSRQERSKFFLLQTGARQSWPAQMSFRADKRVEAGGDALASDNTDMCVQDRETTFC